MKNWLKATAWILGAPAIIILLGWLLFKYGEVVFIGFAALAMLYLIYCLKRDFDEDDARRG